MKAKITLLIGAVAFVTLSFTSSDVKQPEPQHMELSTVSYYDRAPVGGLFADHVVE